MPARHSPGGDRYTARHARSGTYPSRAGTASLLPAWAQCRAPSTFRIASTGTESSGGNSEPPRPKLVGRDQELGNRNAEASRAPLNLGESRSAVVAAELVSAGLHVGVRERVRSPSTPASISESRILGTFSSLAGTSLTHSAQSADSPQDCSNPTLIIAAANFRRAPSQRHSPPSFMPLANVRFTVYCWICV